MFNSEGTQSRCHVCYKRHKELVTKLPVFHWFVFVNKFSLEAQNPRRDTKVSQVLFHVWPDGNPANPAKPRILCLFIQSERSSREYIYPSLSIYNYYLAPLYGLTRPMWCPHTVTPECGFGLNEMTQSENTSAGTQNWACDRTKIYDYQRPLYLQNFIDCPVFSRPG